MKKIYILIIAIFTINVANAQQWTTHGPYDLGSQNVYCIAANSKYIFAGTHGGLYRSSLNGDSWTAVNSGLSNICVNSIAISGNNIFAGTLGGVFLSTNNGDSWISANNGNTDSVVYALAMIGGNIIASTLNHGVFLSTNTGNNWTFTNSTTIIDSVIYSFVVNGNNIYAGTNYGGIFYSTDNGNTWTLINTGITYYGNSTTIISMAINGNNMYVGTAHSGVFLSNDNGTSWTQASLNFPGSPHSLSVKALVLYQNNIIVGLQSMHGGVRLSTDNGNTWSNMNAGLIDTNIQTLTIIGDTIYAGTIGLGVWGRPLADFVGIKENTLNNNISIYPNPTKDILTIETNSNTEQRLEILNLIGQTIYTIYINKKATINTSAFANGVYILKLNTDKETVVRKIVKE